MVNASLYCEICERLEPVIQSERQGLLPKCVLLLYDDARPYTDVQSF